jgi:hypothetical protein
MENTPLSFVLQDFTQRSLHYLQICNLDFIHLFSLILIEGCKISFEKNKPYIGYKISKYASPPLMGGDKGKGENEL